MKQKNFILRIKISMCLIFGAAIFLFLLYLGPFNILRLPLLFLSIVVIVLSIYALIVGYYPTKTRNDLDNGAKIKVLSLFKVKTKKGVPVFCVYEIQYEDGKLNLLEDEDLKLQIGATYTMERTEKWLPVSYS